MYRTRKLLIMGLPGSGKTTLAKELSKEINAIHLNADEMRSKVWTDLTFKYTDRLIQAQRMGALSDMLNAQGYDTIADFVCPTDETRKKFGKAFIVWVDRIKESRFEDTNKLFEKPKKVDVHIKYGHTINQQIEMILKKYGTLCTIRK
jgi:adenylylsulfate kinase-like enzyme